MYTFIRIWKSILKIDLPHVRARTILGISSPPIIRGAIAVENRRKR
jgi:hypothetical protein